MSTPLKDRESFVSKGIDTDVICELCEQAVTSLDTVCRIKTELHTCHGVYCDTCLGMHLDFNNTCPIHEDVVLFHVPQPEFVHGERRAADTLDRITDRKEASDFVCQLFHTTNILHNYKQIFDSDIKEQINAALKDIGERYNHKFGLLIKDEHMAGVMDVAREMVKMHFKVEKTTVVAEVYVTQEFLPNMDEAVGWNHGRGFR